MFCTHCETEFKAGAWYGCAENPTRKHVVERKTYYSESDSYCVNAIPQSSMVGNQGERINIPGKIVTFTGGTYMTTDPELQEVLDREAPMPKQRFIDLRMTPELKQGRDRAVISEQQALITQLQEQLAERNATAKTGAAPSDEATSDPVMAEAGRRKRTKAA